MLGFSKKVKGIEEENITIRNSSSGISFLVKIKGAKVGDVAGKKKILDKASIDSMIDGMIHSVTANETTYNPRPKSVTVTIEHQGQATEEETATGSKREEDTTADTLICYEPRWTLDTVYLDKTAKKQIQAALVIAKHRDKIYNEWKLDGGAKNGRAVVFNFFGPPGTGKSMTAEAIAQYCGRKVYAVNYAQLESKYVGETPKNIRQVFERAANDQAVLIFDEADSFLGKRLTNVSQSADYGVNITRSVMLLELEKFDGIVIFTTNLMGNYDDAFKRRILASVEFKLPDEEGRSVIWNAHLPKTMPVTDEVSCQQLAVQYEGVSGADIKDIVLYAAVMCLQREGDAVCAADFDEAHQFVMNRYQIRQSISIKHEVITEAQYEEEKKLSLQPNDRG